MIVNQLEVVTDRGGVRRSQLYSNVYSITRPEGQAWKIEFHYLNEQGKVVGYGGAAFPYDNVRELNWLEVLCA